MNTNKVIINILIISTIMFTSGCSWFRSKTPSTNKEAAARGKVEQYDNKLAKNDKQKIEQISAFSFGTDYVLSKVTNPPVEVVVAKDINSRVTSLAGTPVIDEMNKMKKMIDQLTSDLAKEKELGKKALNIKDNEIANIQAEKNNLVELKDKEIQKYMDLASATAKKADEYKQTVDEVNSWFGLGGIWYGAKRFVLSSFIFIGIALVLFMILRFAASTNPIASAVFQIFEQMVSWVINTLRSLAPKAINFANLIPATIFNVYKSTLTHIIDNLQLLKEKDPDAKFTIEEILDTFSMEQNERDVITQIKKDLKWK